MMIKTKEAAKHTAQILTISALLLGCHIVSAKTTFPADAKDLCSFGQSDFYSDPSSPEPANSFTTLGLPLATTTYIGPFFDSQSGIVYVFPPQGPTFSSSSNCEFFEWAAQMFLWATSTVDDGANVPSPIGSPSSASPYVFNSEFFYRYADGQLTPQSADGGTVDGSSSFLLRTMKTKSASPADDSVAQAGGNGVLLSQGKNKVSNHSSVVYYGVHTSRVYGYTAAATLQKIAGNEFPSDGKSACEAITLGILEGYTKSTDVSNALFGLFCSPTKNTEKVVKVDEKNTLPMVTKSAQKNAITIPELEPAIDYLSMTVELKTSWVDADSVVNKESYITQKENVPTYTKLIKKDKTVYWKQTGEEVKELALVGMHVVGTVKGHPEMIWATIEHVSNAPNAAYSYLNTDGEMSAYAPIYQQSTSGENSTWLFADGTNSNQNNELAKTCLNSSQDICANEKGKAIGASNIVRTHPWGVKFSDKKMPDETLPAAKADMAAATISSQLISLNTNIMAQLNKFNKTNGITHDPRANYYVSGANWGVNGHIPVNFNSASPKIAGSAYLANTTMETFQQDQGCFGCHSAQPATDKFSTSHIFNQIKAVVKPASTNAGATVQE